MTISYSLYLDNAVAPRDAAEFLRPRRAEPNDDQSAPPPPSGVEFLSDGAVSVHVMPVGAAGAGVAEENGIRAKLSVVFDLFADEVEQAKPVMLGHLLALLERFPGDAVFLDVAGHALMRRRGTRLELARSETFWSPELRARVPEPHSDFV